MTSGYSPFGNFYQNTAYGIPQSYSLNMAPTAPYYTHMIQQQYPSQTVPMTQNHSRNLSQGISQPSIQQPSQVQVHQQQVPTQVPSQTMSKPSQIQPSVSHLKTSQSFKAPIQTVPPSTTILQTSQSNNIPSRTPPQPPHIPAHPYDEPNGKVQQNLPIAVGPKVKVPGFYNRENMCYLNTILQLLIHAPSFGKYFADKTYQQEILGPNKEFVKEFGSFVSLVLENPRNEKVLDSHPIKRHLEQKYDIYKGAYHQDAQEALRNMMDMLHEGLQRLPSPSHLDGLRRQLSLSEDVENWVNKYLEWKQSIQKREDSMVYDTFAGHLMSWIECTSCGHIHFKFELFLDLALPLPSDSSSAGPNKAPTKTSLNYLLEQFFLAETVDHFSCESCKKPQNNAKITKFLLHPPRVIVFSIKRFGNAIMKLDNEVKFPLQNLDLTQHTPKALPTAASYDLYGGAYHGGSLNAGHYTAQLMKDKRWYYCNDSTAYEIREPTQPSRDVYVLFYVRQDVLRGAFLS